MTRSRVLSNRFLPPHDRTNPSRSRQTRDPWGPFELFAEGQWQAIRVGLERDGWSASQIERLHDHLRQGWPLAMAKENVAALTRRCPLRARQREV
ncbi:MAG: hypothetical protein ACK6BG_07235 [Cyanobacteriota bacterium]|jgi:hypothetical protein